MTDRPTSPGQSAQDGGMAHTSTPADEPTSADPSPPAEPVQGSSGDRATWIAAVLIIVLGVLAIGLVALAR